jgi:NADPH-dependent 2,4-dienoyl-CoA reductase/sulfur reductase-like enzyme
MEWMFEQMADRRHKYNVLVVGAGPAGLAAAASAAEAGARIAIVDDNPGAGGQIWRGEELKSGSPDAAKWLRKIREAGVDFISETRVLAAPEAGALLAESVDGHREIVYEKLIMATGARERFLPFPGWTLPNVVGAGGLESLVKGGLPIAGKKVVVAGSGPLLLAVASYLRTQGADVRWVAEQAPGARVIRFGLRLIAQPGKLLQAMGLKWELFGVPYTTGCWPVEANGKGQLESVSLKCGKKTWTVSCDYLACGFNLVPNTELAVLLGCKLEEGNVWVDDFQQTSRANIYSAGEATGVGGLELSLVEGRIAGYAASGRSEEANALFAVRNKQRRFASSLNGAFALRDELKHLPRPSTLVCRCEDVTLGQLKTWCSWREAKLQSRCGMGPCQGRVCGTALEFLLGWTPDSIRPPIFPARVESLAAMGDGPDRQQ